MAVGLVWFWGVLVNVWVGHRWTARPRPGNLFQLPTFFEVPTIFYPDICWDVLCWKVGCCKFALFMTYSFCPESWAHDVCSKFSAEVDAFLIKLFPSLPFFHFELCNLVGILNRQVFLLPFFVSSFSSIFALSFFVLCIIQRVVRLLLVWLVVWFLWSVLPLRNLLEVRQH